MVRALELIGTIFLMSGPVFLILIWRPSLPFAPESKRRLLEELLIKIIRRGAVVGLALVAGISFLEMLVLAQDLGGAGFFSVATIAMLGTVLFKSELGRIVLVRILLALLAWGAVRKGTAEITGAEGTSFRLYDYGAVAAALGCVATFSVTGHAVSIETGTGIAAAVVSDLIHFTAAAVWGGGVWYFTFLPWKELRHEEYRPFFEQAKRRFSIFATTAVIFLISSGIFMAADRMYGPTALNETRYGKDLERKLTLLAVVLLIAKDNLLVIPARWRRARMKRDRDESVVASLRRNVTAEAVGILIIVTIAGFLWAETAPVRQPVAVTVTMENNKYTPDRLELPKSYPIRLTLVNKDNVNHSFGIKNFLYEGLRSHVHDPSALDEARDMVVYVQANESKTIVFEALQYGTYQFVDVLSNYEDIGMVGSAAVR